jgi:hypothetical protein
LSVAVSSTVERVDRVAVAHGLQAPARLARQGRVIVAVPDKVWQHNLEAAAEVRVVRDKQRQPEVQAVLA